MAQSLTLLALLGALQSGCALRRAKFVEPPTDLEVERLGVRPLVVISRLEDGAPSRLGVGSAISISERQLLTCFHLTGSEPHWFVRHPPYNRCEVIATGALDPNQPIVFKGGSIDRAALKRLREIVLQLDHDWIILQTRGQDRGQTYTPAARGFSPSLNDTVFLTGYPMDQLNSDRGTNHPAQPVTVRGRIIEPPRALAPLPETLVWVEVDDLDAVVDGMSGGAISVRDLEDGSLRLIGMLQVTLTDHSLFSASRTLVIGRLLTGTHSGPARADRLVRALDSTQR